MKNKVTLSSLFKEIIDKANGRAEFGNDAALLIQYNEAGWYIEPTIFDVVEDVCDFDGNEVVTGLYREETLFEAAKKLNQDPGLNIITRNGKKYRLVEIKQENI